MSRARLRPWHRLLYTMRPPYEERVEGTLVAMRVGKKGVKNNSTKKPYVFGVLALTLKEK